MDLPAPEPGVLVEMLTQALSGVDAVDVTRDYSAQYDPRYLVILLLSAAKGILEFAAQQAGGESADPLIFMQHIGIQIAGIPWPPDEAP